MKWKEKAKQLETEIYVLYLSFKDPRVPWYAKAFTIAVVAYFLSPIDLIPDFIPVLGYLDDLIIVPAGIYLAIKMIPRGVLTEYRQKAKDGKIDSKARWIGAAIIIIIWLLIFYIIAEMVWL